MSPFKMPRVFEYSFLISIRRYQKISLCMLSLKGSGCAWLVGHDRDYEKEIPLKPQASLRIVSV